MNLWKCSVCDQPVVECECRGPKGSWRPTGGLASDEPLPEGHPMERKFGFTACGKEQDGKHCRKPENHDGDCAPF